MRRVCVRMAVVGVLCFIAGCSEPPTKERDQAIAAIASAREAGAATYAADDIAAADAALKRFDDFVAQRDYKQALNTALDARDRAIEAAKAATTKQTALRAQAATLLATLDAAVASADVQIKTTRVRALAKPTEKLRQARKAAAIALQEARTKLSAGELTTATRRLVDATAVLKRDSDALEEAAKKIKK